MPDVTRRKLLAGALPVVGAGAIALHETIPHTHPWDHEAKAADDMAGMDMSGHGAMPEHGVHPDGHASFAGPAIDHAANGFDPHTILRDFDWGTTRACPAAACCASGSSSPRTRRSSSRRA